MKKKIFKDVVIGIVILSAYVLGKANCDVITETVTETVTETEYVIPSNCIDMQSYEFVNNYVDMREVIDFDATDTGLIIYISDGSSYYWER